MADFENFATKPTWGNPVWYRKFRIFYDRAPYVTGHDWSYEHDDYDGEGDPRYGTEANLQACKGAIDERFFDGEPEQATDGEG